MQPTLVCKQKTLPHDLLPPDLENDKDDFLMLLNAAYSMVLDEKKQNFGLWHEVRTQVVGEIKTRYARHGLTAPRFNHDSFWARIDLPVPGTNAIPHVRLIEALLTDYTPALEEHIRDRLNNDANVHLEFTGPTGMGKSSCSVYLADWIRPIEPTRLVEHLSYDLTELPTKLRNIEPGQTVIQDEYTQQAGEGAATAKALFTNLEDTLRRSQKNLFACSPHEQDHGTMQARLELILWNRERQYSTFLVWLGDVPHGVVALPWMNAELWEVYEGWKQECLERSVRGQFRDNKHLVKMAMLICQDDRFVDFLCETSNKPKKNDFFNAVELFQPQMMASGQIDKMVSLMFNIANNYQQVGPRIEEWFGVAPNAGFKRIADKCYAE